MYRRGSLARRSLKASSSWVDIVLLERKITCPVSRSSRYRFSGAPSSIALPMAARSSFEERLTGVTSVQGTLLRDAPLRFLRPSRDPLYFDIREVRRVHTDIPERR